MAIEHAEAKLPERDRAATKHPRELDVLATLQEEHDEIARALDRLGDFMKASDMTPGRDEWDAFEPLVLRHIDTEEQSLLPAFERESPIEAGRIRQEHAEIRRCVGEIGVALDLHVLRATQVEHLKRLLTSHVALETRTLYPWAALHREDLPGMSAPRKAGPRSPRAADPDRGVILARLAGACRDGERGYRRAAEDTLDPGYRLIFGRHASEHARFANVLDRHLRRLGHRRSSHGTLLGAAHRNWMDVATTLALGSPQALLRECARGEQAAIKLYEDALHVGLPPALQELVRYQLDRLRRALEEVESLIECERR